MSSYNVRLIVGAISLEFLGSFEMDAKKKPHCKYGAKCYRKNPKHFEDYFHPETTNEKIIGTEKEITPVEMNNKPCSSAVKVQQTLQFPNKCDFLPGPKTEMLEGNVKIEKNRLCFDKSVKIEELVNENNQTHVTSKRKRKMSVSKKVKASGHQCKQAKTSFHIKSCENDGELFEKKKGSCSFQSTSEIFFNKHLSVANKSSGIVNIKGKSVKEIIKLLFLVDMPSDFYSFYEFCLSLNGIFPSNALEICKLKLVGPFDVLAGNLQYSVNQKFYLNHWRFYYDPPEFQTVLAADSKFHIGYWRDEPCKNPVFLASNNPDKDCTFKVEGGNIFGTVFNYLNEFMISCDPFKKLKVAKLRNDVRDWALKHEFSLEKKTKEMKEREKKVVSKTFHGAGIVVPVEAKTQLGYRPLIETDASLKKICQLIMKADDETEKESLWENLQPLITAANIANDECDFGNSLELGMDLFCMGSSAFHEIVEHLLSTAYSLLNRLEFEKIIKEHLNFRRQGPNLNAEDLK